MGNRIRELTDQYGVKMVHLANRIGKARNTMHWKIDTDSFTDDERAAIVELWNSIPRVTVEEMFPKEEAKL